jgi:NDP-sugar pyrophosphorylase family protein
VYLRNVSQIFIEEETELDHCILNASAGPIYIGRKATIMEGCQVRGPFALCESAVLKMGTKVYGATTIGPHSVIGGEVKNSIFFGNSNKAHEGYIGDSVIGEWCNLGAGTSNSNVKNTAGEVKTWNYSHNDYITAGALQ